jgi:hypothetical protein
MPIPSDPRALGPLTPDDLIDLHFLLEADALFLELLAPDPEASGR